MQNSLVPRLLKMKVYHNYTINRTGGIGTGIPVPLKILSVTLVAQVR
jgi:hypothetical protein